MRIVSQNVTADTTAAERIRNAALRSFADRGVHATSMRRVARLAKVSVGLVQYHFKNKGGLCQAVNKFVIDLVTKAFGKPLNEGSPETITTQLGTRVVGLIRTHPIAVAYASRALLKGDKTSATLFDTLFNLAREQLRTLDDKGLLRDNLDLDWATLHVILVSVAPLLLEPVVSRHLDHPLLSDKGLDRYRQATTSLLLHGLYRSPRGAPERA